ncbi:MAG: 4-hydroxythreonine-4-phosphate dehydrogenase PdxA [Nitrospina sp.]|nr:4-hydroxythreonine-4-phosphate dehydrogenase PdxA [Nitrospina sp.]
METLPRIAITMGDPAGIGPEVIVKALARGLEHCRPVIIGDAATLAAAAQRFATPEVLHNAEVVDLANVPSDLPQGRASKPGGAASVDYIKRAVDLAMGQTVEAMVTAPINKEALHLAGYPYPGHTELLADLTGVPDSVLMLASDTMRVVLTTTHVALDAVKSLITRERVFRTLQLTHEWLLRAGVAAPTIGVTGLNPHCGDGGIFGQEEADAIVPAVEDARARGWKVLGPFSADALFGRYEPGKYDTIVTMYHDQGMIPIKMASQDRAVNVTLGLPIIRTSVDHGTAYDIAGQGVAKPESLLHAVRLAAQLSQTTEKTPVRK